MEPVTIDPEWIAVYGSNRALGGGGGLLEYPEDATARSCAGRILRTSESAGVEAARHGHGGRYLGDVPYRQAADSTNETPAFDSQLSLTATSSSALDSAITVYLAAAGPTNLDRAG